MFSEFQPGGRVRWRVAYQVSVVLHVAVIALIVYRAAPMFVMPSEVALGTPGSSGTVTYLAPVGAEKRVEAHEKPVLTLHEAKAIRPRLPSPAEPKPENASLAASLDQTAAGGSPYGSRIPGSPLTGHEIIPALPQVFPDPVVSLAALPSGVQGDVVVEVTIDEHGNVIELKLVRGVGYGIDERVLGALRQWKFRPASRDGVTIASQHIVSFHYPS